MLPTTTRMTLTAFQQRGLALQLAPAMCEFLVACRAAQRVRRVTSCATKVSGTYPGSKMRVMIPFESHSYTPDFLVLSKTSVCSAGWKTKADLQRLAHYSPARYQHQEDGSFVGSIVAGNMASSSSTCSNFGTLTDLGYDLPSDSCEFIGAACSTLLTSLTPTACKTTTIPPRPLPALQQPAKKAECQVQRCLQSSQRR